MNYENIVRDNLIFETVTGSHAYGMSLPTSDLDTRGIFIAPKTVMLSPFHNVEQYEDKEKDRTIYELSKFIKLIVDQNPNILELLWVSESDIIFRTPFYDLLRANREALLSSKSAHTFTGYAFAQMKRIRRHEKWVDKPIAKERPRQCDYLKWDDNTNISFLADTGSGYALHRYHGNVMTLHKDQSASIFDNDGNLIIHEKRISKDDALHIVVYDEISYKRDVDEWTGYWSWRNNRNAKRLELEDKFGYDTKHAAHLIRLLRMGKEILATGVVNVFREDAAELLEIRAGKFTYDEIIAMSEKLEAEVKDLYKTTTLPHSCNVERVSKLTVELYESHWKTDDCNE